MDITSFFWAVWIGSFVVSFVAFIVRRQQRGIGSNR